MPIPPIKSSADKQEADLSTGAKSRYGQATGGASSKSKDAKNRTDQSGRHRTTATKQSSLAGPSSRAPSSGIDSESSRATRSTGFIAKWREVGWVALASCVALWTAFPPLGISLLAWVAPIGLIWLIARDAPPGKHGYFCIWLAGCGFWLAILQGIRLAYWPLTFGWLALSMYLAIYVPLFVCAGRILHKRWQWSLAVAAPIAWTGLELWRSYLLTGYAATTLAHTQYLNPVVIQFADQIGGYGISFVMMAAAVALYRLVESIQTRCAPKMHDLIFPAVLVVATLGYGVWRLAEGDRLASDSKPLLRVALIQENTPSRFEYDANRARQAWTRYAQTTAAALREHGPVDLVVWPESTFTADLPLYEDRMLEHVPKKLEEQGSKASLSELLHNYQNEFKYRVRTLQDLIRPALLASSAAAEVPYLLVGNDVVVIDDNDMRSFNTALLIDSERNIVEHYEKIHLVMFGEYIPLESLHGLSELFGLPKTARGSSAKAFEVDGVVLAPSICFESALPQFISWQVRSLVAQQRDPDILVSITNDSWFRGSAILDHHLACEVLSAVEMRRPFLIAANTGLSAWISGSGRLVQVSKRLEPASIIAECTRDSRWGLTQLWGDALAWVPATICGLAFLSVRRPRRRGTRKRSWFATDDVRT